VRVCGCAGLPVERRQTEKAAAVGAVACIESVSFWVLRRVIWLIYTDISAERAVSIFRVK
jgi:hypothetical protein